MAVVMVATLPARAPAAVGLWREECTSSSCTSPPARGWASMAYDEASKSVVLFGGKNDWELNDTWTWNGLRWTKHNPVVSPRTTAGAGMAYDPVSQGVLLFTTGGETWLWQGQTMTWVKQSPPVSPSTRKYPSMAYDPAMKEVVLFGGYDGLGSGGPGETWTWSGATKTWTRHFPATSPSTRSGASMATDPRAKNVVLFGGDLDSGELGGDTWTWDGIRRKWTQHSARITPAPRRFAAMAEDDRGNVVLAGGFSEETGSHSETWTWNGLTRAWSPSVAAGPLIRQGASMAYDAARGRTLLFGGYGVHQLPDGPWLDDSWTYRTVI